MKEKRELPLEGDIIEEVEFKAPTQWTLIAAITRVLELAKDSCLSERFWNLSKEPMDFLVSKLELTKEQILLLSIMAEHDECISWDVFARYLGVKRVAIMAYTEEMENLIEKGWVKITYYDVFHNNTEKPCYSLENGVLSALQHNQCFEPECFFGLDIQAVMDNLEMRLAESERCSYMHFNEDYREMMRIVSANKDLPFCQKVLEYVDMIDSSILLIVAIDYVCNNGTESEGLTLGRLSQILRKNYFFMHVRKMLYAGNHILMKDGIIEHKCEDGMADVERIVLTKKAKDSLLAGYIPMKRKSNLPNKNLLKHTAITPKKLYFNQEEREQIDRLAELLKPEKFSQVQNRLEEKGLRKGFTCLFHGAPGTGKTESVLQLARLTGRDIIQVNIAGMRNKYVGESEKNIKSVFVQYREVCKNSDVAPILFFNEADALINKRTENVEGSVDKMDNAMQNIILQELENQEGILIATTNLTSNLDKAFDRRFLYKVKFNNPDEETKYKIWCSMLDDLSQEDARALAHKYDFSGGQIENIARKRAVDYILYGKKADIQQLESFCQSELLEKRGTFKKVGF